MFRSILTGFLVPLSILIPIGVFLPKYTSASRDEKILFFYLVTAGVINAIGISLSNYGIKNLFLLHIYTILETVFFLLYFFFAFQNSSIRKFLLITAFILPLLFIANFLFLQSINEFNTYTRPVEAIMITAISLLFLYRSGFVEDWLKHSSSWINIGILVYFPAATLIFILSNYFVFVTSNRQLNRIIWDIHSILVLGMYLAFAKAFSLIKRNTDG